MMSKEQALQALDYWIGVSECNCSSELPTGGCEKCDLEGIRKYIRNEPMWVIEEAKNFTGEFWIVGLCRTKKDAESYCRSLGFKWNSEQKLFLGGEYCIRIEKHDILRKPTEQRDSQ